MTMIRISQACLVTWHLSCHGKKVMNTATCEGGFLLPVRTL